MKDYEKLLGHGKKSLPNIKKENLQLNKKRLDDLREQIISYTCAMQDDYGYESVKIRYKNKFEAELSRREWFIEYENERFNINGNNLLKKLKNEIGLQFNSNDFEEFLSHKTSESKNKIINYIYDKTYKDQKGYYLEWYICTLFFQYFKHKKVNNNFVFGVNKPLTLEIDGIDRYIWFQKSIKGISGFTSQPDFTISHTDKESINYNDVMGIIECKNVSAVKINIIRQLFAVGVDLLAKFAILISFNNLNNTMKSGSKNLGINILEIEDNIDRPSHIEEKLDHFMKEESFINSMIFLMRKKMSIS